MTYLTERHMLKRIVRADVKPGMIVEHRAREVRP